jgi:o-succinylbenzoate synthase
VTSPTAVQPIRVTGIELHELALPLAEPFIISGGTMTHRTSLVVVVHDQKGHQGWGESPPFELPFYSEETLASARHLLEQVLIPRLIRAQAETPELADSVLREGIRGNRFARAALDTALWDLEAARQGIGLAGLLARQLEVEASGEIDCGVALGIPPDRSSDTLRRWIKKAVTHGYRRVKIKVAPGWDLLPTKAAQSELRGSGLPLTVDANGAYEWPRHQAALRAFDEYELLYLEQPLAPEELLGHARLSRELLTPICVDETLHDATAARQLAELGGPRIWNIKVHRVGGLTEVCRIYRLARQHGIALWAGTMPESGIGSQAALAAAALPGFNYPSDVEPSSRWFGPGNDVIELTMSAEGRMKVPSISVSGQLDRERFGAAARLLAVTGRG